MLAMLGGGCKASRLGAAGWLVVVDWREGAGGGCVAGNIRILSVVCGRGGVEAVEGVASG